MRFLASFVAGVAVVTVGGLAAKYTGIEFMRDIAWYWTGMIFGVRHWIRR